jgi:hypothetical protein
VVDRSHGGDKQCGLSIDSVVGVEMAIVIMKVYPMK